MVRKSKVGGEERMSGLHIIFPVLGVVFVTAIVALGIFILLRIKAKKNKPQEGLEDNFSRQSRVSEKNGRQEEKEKAQLAEEYIRVLENVERLKREETYKKVFLRCAAVFQVMAGVERRKEKEGMNDGTVLMELENAIHNYGLGRLLTEKGFTIKLPPQGTDKEKLRSQCMELDSEVLRKELREEKRILTYYESFLNFKPYVLKTGPMLYELCKLVEAQNVNECIQTIKKIRETMESLGCYFIFADCPEVVANEKLRVDFLDDGSNATELPGLYSKGQHGDYVLIGNCCGTRRENEKSEG